MIFRVFFFQNNLLNLLVYFGATILVLLLRPEVFITVLRESRDAPIIEAPCGLLKGILMKTRKGRSIDSYRGKLIKIKEHQFWFDNTLEKFKSLAVRG